jgi:hypothetical protein
MANTEKIKKTDEVASKFLVQKLAEQRRHVDIFAQDILEAHARGEESYYLSSLDEVCSCGVMRVIITARQEAWLYKLIATERHARGKRLLRHEGTAYYEGRKVGTWLWYESDDQYARMIFTLDPAFMLQQMQPDTTALELAQQYMKTMEERYITSH